MVLGRDRSVQSDSVPWWIWQYRRGQRERAAALAHLVVGMPATTPTQESIGPLSNEGTQTGTAELTHPFAGSASRVHRHEQSVPGIETRPSSPVNRYARTCQV